MGMVPVDAAIGMVEYTDGAQIVGQRPGVVPVAAPPVVPGVKGVKAGPAPKKAKPCKRKSSGKGAKAVKRRTGRR